MPRIVKAPTCPDVGRARRQSRVCSHVRPVGSRHRPLAISWTSGKEVLDPLGCLRGFQPHRSRMACCQTLHSYVGLGWHPRALDASSYAGNWCQLQSRWSQPWPGCRQTGEVGPVDGRGIPAGSELSQSVSSRHSLEARLGSVCVGIGPVMLTTRGKSSALAKASAMRRRQPGVTGRWPARWWPSLCRPRSGR
jgi:hypothetical protein